MVELYSPFSLANCTYETKKESVSCSFQCSCVLPSMECNLLVRHCCDIYLKIFIQSYLVSQFYQWPGQFIYKKIYKAKSCQEKLLLMKKGGTK